MSTIRVEGFPPVSEQEVVDEFIPFGPIESVSVTKSRADIKYKFAEDATEARLNINGYMFRGSYLKVKETH